MISNRIKLIFIGLIVQTFRINCAIGSGVDPNIIKSAYSGLVDSIMINEIYDALRDTNQTADSVRSLKSILMYSYMDTSVDPCDDFYQYACGNWDNLHPIPNDESTFNIATLLTDSTLYSLKELLSKELYIAHKHEPTPQQKAKIFYDSCIDEYAIGARGAEPLKKLIDTFGGWKLADSNWNPEYFDWINMTTSAFIISSYSLMVYKVEPSFKNGSLYIECIEEPPLGLKNRDIYLDPSNLSKLTAYQSFIEKVLKLLHVYPQDAETIAVEIIEFEMELAKITKDPLSADILDNVEVTVADLIEKYPKIDWLRFMMLARKAPVYMNEKVLLDKSDYYNKLPELIAKTDKRIIINYILWRIVNLYSDFLDLKFIDARQDLNQILFGQLISKPRWETCVAYAKEHFSLALSEMYVRNHFDESIRKDMIILSQDVKETFREFLHSKNWIDEVTKTRAERKLDKLKMGIGYPEYLLSQDAINKEYVGLEIDKNYFFKNMLNIYRLKARKQGDNLKEKIRDRTKWMASPIEVNAYQQHQSNTLICTAALLQAPLVHHHFPKFVNYGSLGATMGHEITHGFDSLGRHFDWNGNFVDWWTNKSAEEFTTREKCFVEQYNNYSMNGKYAKGENSKKENIADNGGLRESYYSYKKWLHNNEGSSDKLINEVLPTFNMTEMQMFFLSYAQFWCEAIRPEKLIETLDTDAHCPGKIRVTGVLSNFQEFSKEFNCPANSRMNPVNKCILW